MELPNSFALEAEGAGLDSDPAANMAMAIDLILQAFESSSDRETVVDTALRHAGELNDAERSHMVQELITQLGQAMDHSYWHRPAGSRARP